MIRCLACKDRFEEFAAYKKHKATADHPDLGEAFVASGAGSVLARQGNA